MFGRAANGDLCVAPALDRLVAPMLCPEEIGMGQVGEIPDVGGRFAE